MVHEFRPGPAVAQDGLVARWQFDPGRLQGNKFKALAGSLDAAVHGPVRFSEQPPGALQLDGNSQSRHYVGVTDGLGQLVRPETRITVEAWVKVDEPLNWGGIVGIIQDNGSYERGWLLGYRSSNFFFAVASQKVGKLTYLTSKHHFEPGNWYYVVGTYDGSAQRLFVDGQLAAESADQSGPIAYPSKASFTIGAYHDDNELYSMAGEIEQVSLWNTVLSGKQIIDNFEARKSSFPGIMPTLPAVVDWPTHLKDNRRTGLTSDELDFPMKLRWVHRLRRLPAPAWPDPAHQDFWHNKTRLRARVIYDRACQIVTVGDRVYFGTSADDRVICLDRDRGHVRWQFFAEAPVRLSPTVVGEKLLFGSDDGFVYCLDASNGSLHWKYRLGPSDRRVPGNGRIMSVWPVRTGVLVEDDTAYFCAGLFPTQGAYQAALNIHTGQKVASSSIGISPQGYLERLGGRLRVITGRDPAEVFTSRLQRRGKGVAREVSVLAEEFPYAFVGTGNARLGGGDGKVAAFQPDDGRLIWNAPVEGRAYGMAVARNRLYVSTDAGHIYCFSAESDDEPAVIEPPLAAAYSYPNAETRRRYERAAERVLQRAAVSKGYCLVLGSGEGRLAYEIARRSDLKIIGVESNPGKVARSRRMLEASGVYGQVAIHQLDPSGFLPYTDYMFNLVVRDGLETDGEHRGVPEEVFRVLRPYGGAAMLGSIDGRVTRRGPLKGAGRWTHMYADAANTACSLDQTVGGALRLQWFGPPGPRQMIDRHHRTVAPLWSNGWLFVPGNDRVTAVDAYNGTVLWEALFPGSRRVGVFRDCSYMAAIDDRLYVAAGPSCHEIDAATGHVKRSFAVPSVANGGKREWGYVAVSGNLLFGSVVKSGAARRGHSRRQIEEGTYYDSRPLVCSEMLFTIDRTTGSSLWNYRPRSGAIINSTITVGDGSIMFVESLNEETLHKANGRSPLSELLGKGANVVSLGADNGDIAWSASHDLSDIQHTIYASYSEGKLAVVGSRNSGSDKERSRVYYDVHVLDAKTGRRTWFTTQDQGTKIGGSHGEQDHHPVIVGDSLICEPFAYDLHTGTARINWAWRREHRSGCGTLSASQSTLFFRDSNPTMFDLTTNEVAKVTAVTRPGCWINILPAGGLLLIPEASSGCTCNFPVQTSMALLPDVAEVVQE